MNFRFLTATQKPITMVSILASVIMILLLASLQFLPVKPYFWLNFCLFTIGCFFTGWIASSMWLCRHPERESLSVHVWGLVVTVGFTVLGITGFMIIRYLFF